MIIHTRPGDWGEADRRIIGRFPKINVAGDGERTAVGECEPSDTETARTADAPASPGSVARAEHMARTRRPLKK